VKVNNEFIVGVPIEETWKAMLDLERVAPCLPGASIDDQVGDEYKGTMRVKVGPITAKYQGTVRYEEVDEQAGDLVPDEIIVEMMKLYLDEADSWILDDLLVERLSGRGTSEATGNIYHAEYDPPPDGPEVDPGPFVQREDDKDEAIRHHLRIYHEQTEPLKVYYADRGILVTVGASQGIPEVTQAILEGITAVQGT
jgi:adenylate kinase family enzyme